jgi:hypothetical protein
MPDYDSHGVEKFRIKIDDMPGAKIEEHFDKVADLIGELEIAYFVFLKFPDC